MRYLLTILTMLTLFTTQAQVKGFYSYSDIVLGGPIELLIKKNGTYQECNHTCMGPVLLNGKYDHKGDTLKLYAKIKYLDGSMRYTDRADVYVLRRDHLYRIDLDMYYKKLPDTIDDLSAKMRGVY